MCVCVYLCVCVGVCVVWSMVCVYILHYECVLITSVRNDLMCAVFQVTDSILPHCGNVSHTFKTGLMLSAEFVNTDGKCQNDCMIC